MPSGGHARSGPPADPSSGRTERGRNSGGRDGWTNLPAGNPKAKAPTFPLEGKTKREAAYWLVLWRKPQAHMWHRQGLVFQVALYCRSFLEAAEPGAPASLRVSVLRMEDTLGLSTVGLAQLRWRMPVDEVGEQRTAAPAVVERPAPTRRLRAVSE